MDALSVRLQQVNGSPASSSRPALRSSAWPSYPARCAPWSCRGSQVLQRVRSALDAGHTMRGTLPPLDDDDEPRHRSQVRGDALRMIERHDSPLLSDSARQQATVLVESDPTDRAATLVRAAADPDYAAAFRGLVRDPANGHRAWS
jgi:hypothetical protein